MAESPLMILLLCLGALYIAKLWRDDYMLARKGQPNPRALPGATGVPALAIWIGVIGAIVLVLIETGGELALGVSAEQTDIAAIFLFSMIAAGVIEEILFRGYLVVTNKGRAVLVASILGFSLAFALLHYQYYTHTPEDGTWRDMTLAMDSKAFWSLLILFLNSLWFYTLRFFPLNPQQSLLPCFAAHIASNVAVFVVKLLQGHVVGLY